MYVIFRFFCLLFTSVAVLLLIINIYGVSQSLRSELLVEGRTDFSGGHLLSYIDSMQKLHQLSQRNTHDERFLIEVANVFSNAIIHITSNRETNLTYHYKVPIWENYFLYFRQTLLDEPLYEFIDYKRAVERGGGQCGQQVSALTSYLQENGYDTSIIGLHGHVVAGVKLKSGKEFVIDPDFGVFIPHSINVLEKSESLVVQYYGKHNLNLWQYYRQDLDVFDKNTVTKGAGKERYPLGYWFEKLSYLFKWALPLGVIIFCFFNLSKWKTIFLNESAKIAKFITV